MLLQLLRKYLAPYKQLIAVICLLQLLATIASLYLPSLNADIIDQGVMRGDTGYIARIGALMLAISLVQIACSVAATYLGSRTAMGFGRDLRNAVFRRVGEFS